VHPGKISNKSDLPQEVSDLAEPDLLIYRFIRSTYYTNARQLTDEVLH
jgi:hypothetical protein